MIRKFMKPVLFLFFFISSFVFTRAQEQQKEVFAKDLAGILKAKDEQAYVKLFPDYPKMLILMKELFSASGQPLDTTLIAMFTEERYNKEMIGRMGESFRAFIEKGEKKGIVWDKTSLAAFTMEFKEDEQDDDAMGTSLKMYSGELELKSEEKTFIVRFKESLWWGADQKFYGADLKKIFEKGMEEPDEEEWGDGVSVDSAMAVTDTAIVMVDSTIAVDEPAPPPPPQNKATVPAKPKTNTKPKTAARKPKS